jgi:three-Cys-motif partner protein
MRETGVLVHGSPLIALNAEPRFNKCLFVDRGERESKALRQRVQPYGGRAVVERADVNRDLDRLMHEHLDPRQPCLVLLDPEGPNLEWSTVEAVSRFRVGRYKAEVLILLPTHMGFIRMLPTESDEPIAGEKLDAMFGTHEWYGIWQRKKSFSINKQQAIEKYVELYEEQLKRLGYQRTMSRLIRARGKLGRKQYHLVFATDNEAGFKIMNHCFTTVYEAKQQSLLEGFDS